VSLDKKALEYHAAGRPGKVKVVPTTPCATAEDLALAYSPGVAAPCLAIEKNPEDAYRYTAKGNLVAVISNGSAVLGLGNIGALAGKPVMEGKGILFKRFADIDVFDIEVDSQDPAEIIRFCEMIAPTFGGINLEDIRAPECFEIEEKLKASLDIPVFHDDQHGTAIISAAAILNGLEIQDKKIEDVKVVFSGAGAAAISCAKLYKDIGVKAENILMCDSRGVMWKGRGEGFNKYKDEFVSETEARTLADAMVGCDVFVGLSQKGVVTQDMVKSMADRPMIFAMANPDPEITPPEVKAARSDAICATGRSDYANQVNNVLGFPFIFRGALDVRASKINEEMKLAATYALAGLAKRREEVPDAVKTAYPGESFDFGAEYIIPKPFDPRVLLFVAPAVAKAAMDSGVARLPIDLEEYQQRLIQAVEEIAAL
jgi:malate dehydrogenase (oxaloacetate-decarboxylating)(NADP+)